MSLSEMILEGHLAECQARRGCTVQQRTTSHCHLPLLGLQKFPQSLWTLKQYWSGIPELGFSKCLTLDYFFLSSCLT